VELAEKVRKARRVYIIGNGGSYANAVHIQNDLEAIGIKAHTLNPASYSATANDHGHDYVFSRWVELHGEPGDLLIALSGSGKSKNILIAIAVALARGMEVFPIFGARRGLDMQQAEEEQLVIGHDVMQWLRSQIK
jgi:D-sedoheptulose 7-phosphate isomerase